MPFKKLLENQRPGTVPFQKKCKSASYYFQSDLNENLFKLHNKQIAFHDKDPPSMNKSIKKKIMVKRYACKFFNVDAYWKLQTISSKWSEMILNRIENYLLSYKLNDPCPSAKSYWFKLKTLYNGKKNPLIPPT